MGNIAPLPTPAFTSAAARVLRACDRPKLEAFIEVAIDLLDAIDGDPDLEDSSDAEPEREI